jgi:5-methylcytosine-specific restriction endonuclease McrA
MNKEWRGRNVAQQREYKKRYRQEHPEEERARHRRWYDANRDNVREYHRRYFQEHKEYQLAQSRKSYHKHKERIAEERKLYRKQNPDKIRVAMRKHNSTRRSMIVNAKGNHTQQDIELLLAQAKGKCWWCGKSHGKNWHLDHRIPLDKGGSNGPENLCISCKACNLSKGRRWPWQLNGRLL